jgi:cation-transporting ATPase E
VFLIALWALVIIARPLSRWKIGLIAAVAASFTMLLYSPLGRQFFALDPTDSPSLLTALAVAAGGMATVEIVARLNHRLTHFWPKWRGRG